MESRAAEDLLDVGGARFSLGKRRFRIKKLKLGTILKVSKLVTSMTSLDERQTVLQSVFNNSGNIKLAAQIIALAILNSRWTNSLYRLLAWWLVHRMSMEDLAQLTKIVMSQMGAQDFFFTMTLTKGMNFLKKKEENSEEERPSTVP